MPGAVDNQRDQRGAPTCPVCCDGFGRAATVVRVGDYMVHLHCVREAQRRVEHGTLAALRLGRTGPQ
jgi:hypothetical protein